ncbi:Transcription factor steA [Psilocybe cubensis]|nr:Transcription factor steA [Psilocybe cubensis]KAH9476147.1 Transcription factor steA [Psilocybe cubensis]
MQRPHHDQQSQQQSRVYASFTESISNPSSTHSSPRTFPSDLDAFYPAHQLGINSGSGGSNVGTSSSSSGSGMHSHISHLQHSQTYPLPAGTQMHPYIPAHQRRPPLPHQNTHPHAPFHHLHQGQGQQYSQTHMQPSRSSSYSSTYTAPMPLQVSTSSSSVTQSEHDPNERTARPGNAHVHTQFHQALSAAAAAASGSGGGISVTGAGAVDAEGAGAGSGAGMAQERAEDGGGRGGSSAEICAETNQISSSSRPSSSHSRPSTSHSRSSSSASPPQAQQQQQQDYTASTPGLSAGLSRPLKPIEQERLAHLDRLKFFLATAPSSWDAAAKASGSSSGSSSSEGEFAYGGGGNGGFSGMGGALSMNSNLGLGMPLVEPAYHHAPPHPALNRFLLPNQEFVTCVLWNGLYHITGTDIVRALVFRFEAFGRPVRNMKKFEEGVFSDLRNLKPGVDACLEEPKSPFLDLLFKYQCIRTQKKQKVFYWFSVPHDRLFLDALERDLKREKMGLEPTTQVVGEPALSFTYDSKRSLYEQFSKAQGVRDGEGELETSLRIAEDGSGVGGQGVGAGASDGAEGSGSVSGDNSDAHMHDESESESVDDSGMTGGEESDAAGSSGAHRTLKRRSGAPNGHPFFTNIPLFEGSPTYKQRRKKGTKGGSMLRKGSEDYPDEFERGRSVGLGGVGVGLGAGIGTDRMGSVSRERGARPPKHPSMLHEFGPGSEDAKAQEMAEMSAADMFLKQARGQLVPGDGVVRKPKPQYVAGNVSVVYHHDGSVQQAQQQMQRGQGQQQHARRASADVGSPDFSDPDGSEGPISASYMQTTFDPSTIAPPATGQTQQQQQGLTSISQYDAASPDGKVRAFVCPLYSCQRLFKRMEHLKRHLRTHTLERPFSCTRCGKKFSRSDNLTQHLRTHERTGHGAADSVAGGAGAGAGGDPINWMEPENPVVEGEGSTGGSPGQSMPGGEDDGAMPDMLDFGAGGNGIVMFGGEEAGLGRMVGIDMNVPYDIDMHGFSSDQLDERMCEVEVPGGVRDVQGDEEGEVMRMGGVEPSLVFRQQQQQMPGSEFPFVSQPSSDFSDGQWATRPTSTHGSPAGGFARMYHTHSSSSSQSSNFGEDFGLASLSAPSHRQSFDHAGLYPPNLLEGGGIGPVRRHRSMTPSLARNGEPIRRPMTANSSDLQGVGGGSPGSVSSMNSNGGAGARGYHPYYSNNNSRANSTHNSPQVHSIPLGGELAAGRPGSRGSSYGGVSGLHEQMRQMMSMDGGGSGAGATGSVFGENAFRTGSPASFHQTESPGTFSIDLPLQYTGSPGFNPAQQQVLHAATMPQFGSSQQQQYDGYYHNVQQPHATL